MLTKKPTVLITGASKGIGRALAYQLTQDGSQVLGVGRSENGLRTSWMRYFNCDLSDAASLAALASTLQREFPLIDLLVHNAAIGFYGRLEDQLDLAELLRTNALAPILLTRLLANNLFAATQPRVVFISSVHSRFPAAQFAAYAASKCALEGLPAAFAKNGAAGSTYRYYCPALPLPTYSAALACRLRYAVQPAKQTRKLIAAKIAARLTGPPARQTLCWRDYWIRRFSGCCAALLDRRAQWQPR